MADPSDLLIDRTLVLLRHAKAVPHESMPDFERPLTDRGRADAAAAGRWLVAQGIEADLVLCSPSQRTRETWKYAAEAGAVTADAWYDRRIYNGTAEELLDVIHRYPDHVWVFLHEFPALTGDRAEQFRGRRRHYEQRVEAVLQAGVDSGEFRDVHPRLTALAWLGMHNYTYLWLKPGGRVTLCDLIPSELGGSAKSASHRQGRKPAHKRK